MFIFFIEPINAYFVRYPYLNSVAHLAAGFGLAVLLQHYLKGNSFVSVYVGWLLVIIAAALHAMPFFAK